MFQKNLTLMLAVGLLLSACAQPKFRGAWYATYGPSKDGEKKDFVLAIINESETEITLQSIDINGQWSYPIPGTTKTIKPGEIRIVPFVEFKNKDGHALEPNTCVLPVSVRLQSSDFLSYPLELPPALPLSIPEEYACCRGGVEHCEATADRDSP